ncbi:MAG: PEP/pyruvate-binding domain-containing protein [Dissulfuribacterales bacterium]
MTVLSAFHILQHSHDLNSPSITGIFRRFQRIIELNSKALEIISAMEESLGGAYLFDKVFIGKSISTLNDIIREVIYNLNAMSKNAHLALYERFEAIKNSLEDILSGGPGPYHDQITLHYNQLNMDMDIIVGAKNANLGEIWNRLHLRIPDGFALTTEAYRLFMEENGLLAHITQALDSNKKNMEDTWRHIRDLFEKAAIPNKVEQSVKEALEELYERLGRRPVLAVRSSAVGEDMERSFAGQFTSILNVRHEDVLSACKRVMAARFSPQVMSYLGNDYIELDAFPVAIAVQEMITATVSGVIYTRNPSNPLENGMVISAVPGIGASLVDGSSLSDWYRLSRTHPFKMLESRLNAKENNIHSLDTMPSGLRRGSALLTPRMLRLIAEAAITIEKSFGRPQDIEWTFDAHDNLIILQARPLHVQYASPTLQTELVTRLKQLPLLMKEKGQAAHVGIATGPVVHVSPEDDFTRFPVGAIAVCKNASPALSPILQKAAAIVTDIGSPTGHLAAIAREYRTPAIVGAENATVLLKEGMEVTVDAYDTCIYAGGIPDFFTLETMEEDVFFESDEVRTMRRLLRWIAPLNLVDPSSTKFALENCETYHDILRFSHEKAVESLINLQSFTPVSEKMFSKVLKAPIPIGMHIIDLGGGIKSVKDKQENEVAISDISSKPFNAILKGLLKEGVWDKEPAPIGIRDILSNIARPSLSLMGMPEYSGRNLAIIAENYCNISLRLGYHFNVIDSYLTSNPDNNYIYFRFVGGFADEERRKRRASLIVSILQALFFKVEHHGDLVVGKVKMLDAQQTEHILIKLGELIAFTRQLDVRMTDEESIDRFFARFLQQTRSQPPSVE